MINAQRMGDSIIRESKQKAAEIIRSANIKAEDREQRARDDVELAKQEIVTLKGEADSFKRSLIEMYRKHINLINKLPDYTRRPEDEPVPPPSPAPEQAAATAAEPQPAVQAPVYTAPAAQPVPESAPVQQAAQMPAMQETTYYEPPTAQPVPEPTESAQAQGRKGRHGGICHRATPGGAGGSQSPPQFPWRSPPSTRRGSRRSPAV